MTEQAKEKLRYKGKTYSILAEPLESYLSKSTKRKGLIPPNTACWRGYYGSWKVKYNKLYLIKLEAYIENYKKVGMDYFFPDEKEVFADWFSGEIIIIDDDNMSIGYAFYSHIIGDYLSLKFKNGELIESKLIKNQTNEILP